MKTLREFFAQQVFNVGFLDSDYNVLDATDRTPKVSWLKLGSYNSGWFADPFILEINDTEIVLLVEEYEYKKSRGRICEIVVEKDTYKLKKIKPILENKTHFSFPYIIRKDGVIYVCPENYESGAVSIYRREKDGMLVDPIEIINAPLVDTQIIEINGVYYAFGVETISGHNNESKVLKVYKSVNLLAPFKYVCDIKTDFAEERGAGLFFYKEGDIIRPAQSCERSYGDSLVFYKININGEEVREQLVGRIYPKQESKYGLGIHTYNEMNGVQVVDGKEYRRYPISRIAKLFKK